MVIRTVSTVDGLINEVDSLGSGDTVVVEGGTYSFGGQWEITSDGITIRAADGARPVLLGPGRTSGAGSIKVYANNALIQGFEVAEHGFKGIFAARGHGTTFEDIIAHDNHHTGIMNNGGENVTFRNCVSYNNHGNNQDADGFNMTGPAQNGLIEGCRAYNNGDDGYDMWVSENHTIRDCWSWNNGRGDVGNGNGFKLGSSNAGEGGGHTVERCVSFDNVVNNSSNSPGSGFWWNGEEDNVITVRHCTAWGNGVDFAFRDIGHVLEHNISVGNNVDIGSAVNETANTWNLGITDPMLRSTDPDSDDFARLSVGSPCIGAASDGSDLGAFQADGGPGQVVSSASGLLNAVDGASPGDVIVAEPGEYVLDDKLRCLTPDVTVRARNDAVMADSTGPVTTLTDGFGVGGGGLVEIRADNVTFRGFEVQGSGSKGIEIDGSPSGVEVAHVDAHDNYNWGVMMNSGSGHVIRDSHSHDNRGSGGNSDGFNGTGSTGCTFLRCWAWNNSDDGFDMWDGENHTLRECWAWNNGPDGQAEFKLGQVDGGGGHTVERCVAYNSNFDGFRWNGTHNTITVRNCTAYNCATDFNFHDGTHVLENNISAGNNVSLSGADESNNTWNLGISDPGFVSEDPGSEDFLRLASGSPCIGAGVNGGDLGALGTGGSDDPPDLITVDGDATLVAGDADHNAESLYQQEHSGYTGGGYINFNPLSGAWVEWPLAVETPGEYDVEIRYANGGTSARECTLYVGDSAQPITFDPTGEWTSWSTMTVPVTLPEGETVMGVETTGADGGNIDHIGLVQTPVNPCADMTCGDCETCEGGDCVPVDNPCCGVECGPCETCEGGDCVPVDNPCCGVECGSGEECIDGECVPTDGPCATLTCGPCETCVEISDTEAECQPVDNPCCGVSCGPCETCESGDCVPVDNPCCGVSCPDGQVCEGGDCVPADDGGNGGGGLDPAILFGAIVAGGWVVYQNYRNSDSQ